MARDAPDAVTPLGIAERVPAAVVTGNLRIGRGERTQILAQGLTEFEFYGKPWENARLYDELSPIRFVQNVRTPTLIVQSEEDHRTPMADAEQWFTALRKQDVPVEFIRYPRSTHDLSRTGEPWLLVDRLGRLRQWFTYWLIERPMNAN